VNVDIDADPGLVAGDTERQVGAFGTDSGERHHHLGVTGKFAIEFVADFPGDGANLLCLARREGHITNELGDFGDRGFGEFGRSSRFREESRRGEDRNFVARADRKHAGDELLERGRISLFRQFEHRRLGEGFDRLRDLSYRDVDIERVFRHVVRPPRSLRIRHHQVQKRGHDPTFILSLSKDLGVAATILGVQPTPRSWIPHRQPQIPRLRSE
jgi:hypothetical protein